MKVKNLTKARQTVSAHGGRASKKYSFPAGAELDIPKEVAASLEEDNRVRAGRGLKSNWRVTKPAQMPKSTTSPKTEKES